MNKLKLILIAVTTTLLTACASNKQIMCEPLPLPPHAKVSELQPPPECEPSCLEGLQRLLDTPMNLE